jgi:hypothetical protein
MSMDTPILSEGGVAADADLIKNTTTKDFMRDVVDAAHHGAQKSTRTGTARGASSTSRLDSGVVVVLVGSASTVMLFRGTVQRLDRLRASRSIWMSQLTAEETAVMRSPSGASNTPFKVLFPAFPSTRSVWTGDADSSSRATRPSPRQVTP